LDITIPNISNVDSILVDSDFVKGNSVNPRLLREEAVPLSGWAKASKWSANQGTTRRFIRFSPAVAWDLHTGLDIFDGLVGFSFSERAIVRIS
jgi:hypothetical protein